MAIKKEKTGPCVKNRNGDLHAKQAPRDKRPGRGSGSKCIKKISRDGEVLYDRVKNKIAEDKTDNHGWTYCSKEEYKLAMRG
jgi:hypothetical protein